MKRYYISLNTLTDNSHSKRAFQTQFKRWNFPSKQSAAFKDQQLIARIGELWERNCTQAEMLEILQNEGHNLGDKELARVRKKNGMIMRAASTKERIVPAKRKKSEVEPIINQVDDATDANEYEDDQSVLDAEPDASSLLPPEVAEQRQKRREALHAESDERYQNKTRRRRTRPWAGLPADPPGPPRFPSETTIDEAKRMLGIAHEAYVDIRKHCEQICKEEGVRRKVEAGAEKWKHVLDRMTDENHHLRPIFHDSQLIDHKDHILAVEVIANDVTKRMRTHENRLTIQDCKNILQINPEQARQLRKSFEDILRADSFTNKFEAGVEHWNDLKRQWLSVSPHLAHLMAPGTAEADLHLRAKAMELLCRDVMKRYRDEKTRKGSSAAKQTATGTTSSKGVTKLASRALAASTEAANSEISSVPSTSISFGPPTSAYPLQPMSTVSLTPHLDEIPASMPPHFDYSNLQIDPELLLAANGSSRIGT